MNPFNEYINTLQSAHMESEFHNYQEAFNNYKRIIILDQGHITNTGDTSRELIDNST